MTYKGKSVVISWRNEGPL